jgi:hypothetical protein
MLNGIHVTVHFLQWIVQLSCLIYPNKDTSHSLKKQSLRLCATVALDLTLLEVLDLSYQYLVNHLTVIINAHQNYLGPAIISKSKTG